MDIMGTDLIVNGAKALASGDPYQLMSAFQADPNAINDKNQA